ncbi:ATP-NAD kinase family protein [Mycetohabitans rhizoxinica]|uniref:NAD(+)/NADH kinase n=1 Tax=Mycetohabitans rhizoxinica TaxID=412963 RepID=A0ABZ2PW16_9BURK
MSSTVPAVGIIANPASGRDIRRLTSHASVFPTAEKANMVVRLFAGLGALGVRRVLTLRDKTGVAALVLRAVQAHAALSGRERWPQVEFADLPMTQSVADTHAGVAYMVERGVSLIAVLGGDGTHRAVAMNCRDVPLLTLSTGTNNSFPDLREATVAGLAGALVATGSVPPDAALSRNKRLVVRCVSGRKCGHEEIALVDLCVSRQRFIGARALSDPSDIHALFLTFAAADAIGLSSIGAAWAPVARTAPHGLQMTFADAPLTGVPLVAPIAPGQIGTVWMTDCERLEVGQQVMLDVGYGTLALDGEREIEIEKGETYVVSLDWAGPLTVDVERTLRFSAARQFLRERAAALFN